MGAVTEAADAAIRSVMSQLAAGRIEQEPDLTSQLVGEIRGELRRPGLDGYSWDLKVLSDRGPGAQERKYGADLLVVQHFDTEDYAVAKGFLAQAKLSDRRIRPREVIDQCERMLSVTPDAFVFRYQESGLAVASASATVASGGSLNDLRWKPFSEFLLDFMTSFIGDRRLRAATADELQRLREEYDARMGLHIRVVDAPR